MSLHNLNLKQRQELVKTQDLESLHHICQPSFDITSVVDHFCENVIGVTQVPLGIAGPLLVHTSTKLSDHTLTKLIEPIWQGYIPLATTEGALVASVNRGCKAIFQSGGVATFVENKGVSRGPYLQVQSIKQGLEIIDWIKNNWQTLEAIAQKTSNHLTLLPKWEKQLLGTSLYLRFYFDTSLAMGMNMVTIATGAIVDFLVQKFELKNAVVSGNFCVDKKPSFSTFANGRGRSVWAEVVIPKEIVKTTLKTTPEKIVEVIHAKQIHGSMVSGSLGFNAHFANIVAALYLATGQDIAHVVEGSLGVTSASLQGEDLYFSIYLPAVLVGIVGGGTSLPTQKEALEILKVTKEQGGDCDLLSSIVAGAVLAGELSLTAALASNSLVKAHQNLGRGKGTINS